MAGDQTAQGERGSVSLRGVTKRFGDMTAVDRVTLHVEPSEFISLLGPSGCGKTTTLRLISGFERPSSGSIMIGGIDATDVPAHKRNVNTIFQNYALFKHLTVAENIAFGLKVKRQGKTTIARKVNAALDLVKLPHLTSRYPSQLSGGQQQRVALARAIVNEPEVLLLDEPLSALDLKLRQAMRFELSQLHRDLGMTFIFVTHDQGEAITMSDRIAVMHEGRIQQLDTPLAIYERPASRFVASFIGETNLIDVTVTSVEGDLIRVKVAAGQSVLVAPTGGHTLTPGQVAAVAVRPQRVVLESPGTHEDATHALFPGVLRELLFIGDETRAVTELTDGSELIAVRHNQAGSHPFGDLRPGDHVEVGWRHGSACVVDE
ncbi:MAG: ABC transporter ATP-binding protein [Actinobacteria bacterium]|nr:ABC transporter ATP-binding protein [Actinomycetota bacterium]